MAIGDKIVVGDQYNWKDDGSNQAIPVYKPVLNPDGSMQLTPDGAAIIQVAGGVTVGSTGTIQGNSIKVPRSYLTVSIDKEGYSPPTGKDWVDVFPIFLDKYKQVGWLPGDFIRII